MVNREGNVHDSHRALETLEFLVGDVRENLAPRHLEARFDGAFFRREILEFLGASGIEYGIKAPLWDWLGIRPVIRRRQRWKRIGLDLFDPNDGHYEYSSVATNKRCRLRALWDFMAGRGGHEKTLGELKQHLAFDTIPTRDWDANSTWQLIGALTHNVLRQFQITTTASERKNSHKRTYRWVLESLRTFRYEVLNLPAKIARPGGRAELRIAASKDTEERILQILGALPEAA